MAGPRIELRRRCAVVGVIEGIVSMTGTVSLLGLLGLWLLLIIGLARLHLRAIHPRRWVRGGPTDDLSTGGQAT